MGIQQEGAVARLEMRDTPPSKKCGSCRHVLTVAVTAWVGRAGMAVLRCAGGLVVKHTCVRRNKPEAASVLGGWVGP